MDIVDQAEKPKDFKPKGKYVVRTPTDQQRVRLEKLMAQPEKPVAIPMSKQQKDLLAAVPTFVRNVMGSSAGAGSGEFHVYRHLRRKEFARQKQIQHKSKQVFCSLGCAQLYSNVIFVVHRTGRARRSIPAKSRKRSQCCRIENGKETRKTHEEETATQKSSTKVGGSKR